MNAAQWIARFAGKDRPSVPSQANARFARAAGIGVHRQYHVLPPTASQNAASILQGHAGLVGGAGYTHSTAPGGRILHNPTQSDGHH